MAIFPKIQSPCPYKGNLSDIMDGDLCRLCKRQVFACCSIINISIVHTYQRVFTFGGYMAKVTSCKHILAMRTGHIC